MLRVEAKVCDGQRHTPFVEQPVRFATHVRSRASRSADKLRLGNAVRGLRPEQCIAVVAGIGHIGMIPPLWNDSVMLVRVTRESIVRELRMLFLGRVVQDLRHPDTPLVNEVVFELEEA